MKHPGLLMWVAVLALLGTAPVFSQGKGYKGQGRIVITMLPKRTGVLPPSFSAKALSIKVNGDVATVTSWKPLQGANGKLELVLLIDGSSRSSLALQFDDIAHFVKSLPPNVKSAIAYMNNGRAVFSSTLSADHAEVLRGLHLPGGLPGSEASPYFCLSDLANKWPSEDRAARREVLLVTDGLDDYEQRYDPDDPYVQTSIKDSVRAGLIVYSIYWHSEGRYDSSFNGIVGGQSHLMELAAATGGKALDDGMGSPVSFAPMLHELAICLRNQYEVGFAAPLNGKAKFEYMKLKLDAPDVEVTAPQNVMVFPAAAQD